MLSAARLLGREWDHCNCSMYCHIRKYFQALCYAFLRQQSIFHFSLTSFYVYGISEQRFYLALRSDRSSKWPYFKMTNARVWCRWHEVKTHKDSRHSMKRATLIHGNKRMTIFWFSHIMCVEFTLLIECYLRSGFILWHVLTEDSWEAKPEGIWNILGNESYFKNLSTISVGSL